MSLRRDTQRVLCLPVIYRQIAAVAALLRNDESFVILIS